MSEGGAVGEPDQVDHPGSPGRLRRHRRLIIALSMLLAGWLVACTVLLVFPSVDAPKQADAVVVLGPPGAARLSEAMTLLHDGVSSNLVISVNSVKQRAANALCEHPPAGITVHCFHPDPPTTRGEGRGLQKLISANGWTSVAVVTSKYHISRARFILNNCTDGAQISMVAASSERISAAEWAYQFLYQTAGFAKALLQFRC